MKGATARQPRGVSNTAMVALLAVVLIAGVIAGHFLTSGNQASYQPATTAPTTVPGVTTILNKSHVNNTLSAQNTSSPQIIREVIYSKKTVTVPAPTYNPYYNYVIGCYWTSGAYNFSFYAPYAGYVVFNETNSGIPNNFSYGYFVTYISRQKPLYFKPQPYNDTSFCPGWGFLSQIDPWVSVYTYDNQTAIIPVKNGTNYVLFYNENANQKHGVNPFPINVTFSMTYYGFEGVTIPNPPNTTTPIPPPNSIYWGGYP
jgi:hypothetical protein